MHNYKNNFNNNNIKIEMDKKYTYILPVPTLWRYKRFTTTTTSGIRPTNFEGRKTRKILR